ncbi:hypothetical protein MBANPS3_010343 [Mucor bainieri]
MQAHYKLYPPKKRYIHVINFMEELYQMHKSQEVDGTLFSAIVQFLLLVYLQKSQYLDEDGLKKTQYVFVLPEKYSCNQQFLEEMFRPALEIAYWLSESDSKSKALFTTSWTGLLYHCQSKGLELGNEVRLQRERKYILCDIQKMAGQNKLKVVVNTAKMVYDPDFVKASKRSLTLLGEDAPLVPKMLDSILSTELSFNCSLDKMKKFAKLVFLKVFAKSSDDTIGDDVLEDYYSKNPHYNENFMHRLIESLTGNYNPNRLLEYSLQYFPWNECALTKEQRERLCKIECEELYAIFEDENWRVITESILKHITFDVDKEVIAGVIINTESREIFQKADCNSSWWHHRAYRLLLYNCTRLYFAATRRTLKPAIFGLDASYHKLYASIAEMNRPDGYLYKTHKMIDLANKLACPVIVGSAENNTSCLSHQAFEFDGIIDQLQPYHYFANFVINSNNTIQMSLKQVIETRILGDNEYEKSTIARLDHIYNLEDPYGTISDILWVNLMKQEDHDTSVEHYSSFKLKMTSFLKTIIAPLPLLSSHYYGSRL